MHDECAGSEWPGSLSFSTKWNWRYVTHSRVILLPLYFTLKWTLETNMSLLMYPAVTCALTVAIAVFHLHYR